MPEPRYHRTPTNSGLTQATYTKVCGHRRGYRCTCYESARDEDGRFDHEADVVEQMRHAKRRFRLSTISDVPDVRLPD